MCTSVTRIVHWPSHGFDTWLQEVKERRAEVYVSLWEKDSELANDGIGNNCAWSCGISLSHMRRGGFLLKLSHRGDQQAALEVWLTTSKGGKAVRTGHKSLPAQVYDES